MQEIRDSNKYKRYPKEYKIIILHKWPGIPDKYKDADRHYNTQRLGNIMEKEITICSW